MPGPSPVNSACLDDGQEPTGCCKSPPNISVELEYVSARQDCNPSSCGETPCTSTEAVYDNEGNCVSAAQVCSPNWADLTPAEKCAAKRYLTITTVDRSGGGEHGRTQVKQYTAGDEGACSSETTCSGTVVTVTVETGEYTGPSGGSTPACSSRTTTGESETTTTETKTWNNDCTTTNEVECAGSSSFTDTCVGLFGGSGTTQCNSNFIKIDGSCQWQGFIDGDFEFNDNCLNAALLGGQYELVSETTITPEPECSITVTFTEENTVGNCTPPAFPAFPAFVDCTPEGEEPPEPPELTTGQGYDDEVFKFVSPVNPASKTEQKIRFRVKHTPTGTCYLKVWFRKKIQQWKYEDCDTGFAGDPPRTASWEGVVDCEANPCTSRWSTNGAPTFEAAGTYEWRGTGYPCFSDDSKPPDYCVNAIYSSEPVEVAATGNQTIFIEFKFSQLEGYEPNWGDENGYQGCKPNGFPIPDPADCP